MNKKITLSMAAALLLIPLGVSLAATPTDSEFNAKAQEMRANHQAFKEARSQAATPEVANANTNTTYGQTKAQILEKRAIQRKATLLKILDLQIAYFERVQKRVDNMPNILDTEKTRLTNQINTSISGLEAKKTEIDAISSEDLLITKASDLRTAFIGYHGLVKVIVEAIHASKIARAEEKTSNRATAIATKLEEMAAAGKDVTDLQTQLSSAQTLITDSQTLRKAGDYQGAIAKLKEAYAIFRTVSQAAKKL